MEILEASRGSLRFTMTGTGLSRALIFAPGLRQITIGGRPVPHRPAERVGTHWVQTVLSHLQKVNVEATRR